MIDAITGKEMAAIPPKDRVYTCQQCSRVSMDNEQFRLIQFLGIAFVICFDCILGDRKVELERKAAEKAWDRCVGEMPIDPDWKIYYGDNNPYRREETE